MHQERQRRVKDVVLKIGDRTKIFRGVTEHTTCGDVIKMVLRKVGNNKQNAYSYAMFECVTGSERMLPDQSRVLKTMRSWGSGKSYHFSLKAAPQANTIFKTKEHKRSQINEHVNNLDKANRIQSATKLAKVVKSQKTKLQRHQSNNHVTGIYHDDGETSINEFMSNVDQTKMAGFLEFCGSVSANELGRLSGKCDSSTANEYATDAANGFVTGRVISETDKVNDVKYAMKKVLNPKLVTMTLEHRNAKMAKKHTFVDCEPSNVPTHSTPTRFVAKRAAARHEALAESITSKIARIEQRAGKDTILQKYFSDYLSYNSPNGKYFPFPERERGDGAELSFSLGNPDKGDGSFSTGTQIHSNLTARARCHSDSDSGQEDHDNGDILDNAFVCQTGTDIGDSKVRNADIKQLSWNRVKDDVTMATNVNRLVDYSFSDSSILESDEGTINIFERNVSICFIEKYTLVMVFCFKQELIYGDVRN